MINTKSDSGFALLEALIAMLLFSIGILGMVAMQARATQYSVDAEDRTRAALLANEVVAVMWNQNSATVSAADLATWQARVANVSVAGLPGGLGAIATTTDALGTTSVVSITWTAIGKTAAASSSSSSSAASSASSASSASAVSTNSLYTTTVFIP